MKMQTASSLVSRRAATDIDKALGARIRSLRTPLGIRQADLARIVGVSYQQIQKYEHGANRISVSTLFAVAQALGVSASSLVADLDNPEPRPEAVPEQSGGDQ